MGQMDNQQDAYGQENMEGDQNQQMDGEGADMNDQENQNPNLQEEDKEEN